MAGISTGRPWSWIVVEGLKNMKGKGGGVRPASLTVMGREC